jgi:hypothetical protein
MKKIIFTVLIAFATSLVITSCTEDEVTPHADSPVGSVTGESVRR